MKSLKSRSGTSDEGQNSIVVDLAAARATVRSTLAERMAAGEFGPAEIAAYNCFAGLGFAPTGESVAHSLLARMKAKGHMPDVAYSDDFFVEEIIFALALTIEAQERFGFVGYVIEQISAGLSTDQPLTAEAVISTMTPMAYSIAIERMALAGLRTALDPDTFWSRLQDGMDRYAELLDASLACEEPLPDQAGAGLDSRDHPHSAYLGAASDRFAQALGLEASRRMDIVLLQTFLVIVWTSLMEALSEAVASAQQ